MKKIVLFVLALVAAALANEEEETVERIAEHFETDVRTIEMCFQEAETNIMEIHAAHQKLKDYKSAENVNEDTEKIFAKQGRFLACLMETKDMMKDSKLVTDKILESMDSEKNAKYSQEDKEAIIECIKELNENIELTEKDRALGLAICFIGEKDSDEEK